MDTSGATVLHGRVIINPDGTAKEVMITIHSSGSPAIMCSFGMDDARCWFGPIRVLQSSFCSQVCLFVDVQSYKD